MFDFVVEMHPQDIAEGIGGFSTANITIKAKDGLLSSKRDKAPYQDVMIFSSLSDFLYGLIKFINNNEKKYTFEGDDSSFSFYIFNKNDNVVITDTEKSVIVETSKIDFLRSIWKGIRTFANQYKDITPVDYTDVFEHFYTTLEEFETQFANKLKPSEQQTTQDDLSYFKPNVYPPKPDHIIPTGIEGLLTVYFAKDYDELVEQYGFRRLITQIVAKYKEDQHPAVVKHCLDEVSSLVAQEHNEKYLRDKIVNEYGVKIPISKLGGLYQIFLERLHEELVGKRLYT